MTALPAARAGDPIAHGGAVTQASSEALVCVALGALLAPAGCGGAVASALGAAVSSAGRAAHGMAIAVGSLVPGAITGAVGAGSPNTFIGGVGAALAVAQPLSCALHPPSPIVTGSASVFVNEHPVARESDPAGCGALVAGGAPTVLIGGAAAAGPLPSPLAALSGSAAKVATAMGSALAQGASAALRTAGMVDALVQRGAGAVADVESQATALEARLATQAGAIVGTVSSALTGPLLGGLLAG